MKLLRAALATTVLASAAWSGSAVAAFATGGLCSAGAATNGITVTNMTLNGSNSSDCYGTVNIGGDVANEIGNINALGWGTYSASNYIKDDVNGGVSVSFLGMTWTLNANNGANDSTYTLTVTDQNPAVLPNLPLTVDIVGFLKAGTPGAFYFFDDAVIDVSNNGTFKIVWTVGNNGANPGLSGLSLFVGQPGTPPNKVPEPATLGLLGLGLLGLVAARRRR